MLGGADNPNGELLSYIIGADNGKPAGQYSVNSGAVDLVGSGSGTRKINTTYLFNACLFIQYYLCFFHFRKCLCTCMPHHVVFAIKIL